jgi:hypothetical protein
MIGANPRISPVIGTHGFDDCGRVVGKTGSYPRANWVPTHVNWRKIAIALVDAATGF